MHLLSVVLHLCPTLNLLLPRDDTPNSRRREFGVNYMIYKETRQKYAQIFKAIMTVEV